MKLLLGVLFKAFQYSQHEASGDVLAIHCQICALGFAMGHVTLASLPAGFWLGSAFGKQHKRWMERAVRVLLTPSLCMDSSCRVATCLFTEGSHRLALPC